MAIQHFKRMLRHSGCHLPVLLKKKKIKKQTYCYKTVRNVPHSPAKTDENDPFDEKSSIFA